MMIDTGETNGKCAMGNLNYREYEKERGNLVEKLTRNQSDMQQQVKELMINPCTAETASDTGQLDIRNIFKGTNEKEINQVSAKKNENQERNHQNNKAYEDVDMDDDEQRLTIEVELNHKDAADANEAAALSLSYMVKLIKE